MISPAKTAADSPFWRSIKYSLFPPLGLATLAGYLDEGDDIVLQDEHVEKLDLDDAPDLVVIEAYITSANRAYAYADHYRAKGAYVCLGGLHPTSMPEEAARHADSDLPGARRGHVAALPGGLPGRKAGPRLPLHATHPGGHAAPRRDLIKRQLYLVPNSLVVSRGCPHICDFCYKDAFFAGGKSFYMQAVDEALAEIDRLPGRHLYFLDDNLFGSPPFATALFDGLRAWVACGRRPAPCRRCSSPAFSSRRSTSGLRSLFVGFETLTTANLQAQHKLQNLGAADDRPPYEAAVRRLHDLGVMVNAASSSAWTTTIRPSSSARSTGRCGRASRPPRSTS